MEINLDNQKLMFHPKEVYKWMNGEKVYPIYVEVSLTNRCNHQCIYCAINFSQSIKKDLDFEVIKNAITSMSKVGVKSIMFGGEGEPLLYPKFIDIVKHAKSCGMKVALTTNGVLLNFEKIKQLAPLLSWIKFSLDTSDFKMYSLIHRTKQEDLKKAFDNLSKFSYIKRLKGYDCTVGGQAILLKGNMETIPKLAKILKYLKADYFVIKPFSEHEQRVGDNMKLISEKEINDIKGRTNIYETETYKVIFRDKAFNNAYKERSYDKCYGKDFVAYIDTNGGVYSCINYIGNPDYSYGNIYDNSFEEIWGNKKEINPDLNKCRTVCRLDEINRYLCRLKNPVNGDNFI